MTGIVIFTAGREDAYQDYLRSVKQGHEPSEVSSHADVDFIETVTDPETNKVHVWGTSVESKWRSVEKGDIALVYRDSGYIAQATVADTSDNRELAEHLWQTEGNPWNPDNPWRFLTFFVGVEQIDIDIHEFNNLVDYEDNYIPQGFSRVADHRVQPLADQFGSVETAIKELTGVGVRVHEIEEEDGDDEEDEDEETTLGDEIVEASTSGDDHSKFEQLVAKAFSRLGFEAKWIEGGNDTDVEITAPVHAIVEVKARSKGILQSPDAARIQGHKDRRQASQAIVVAPGFAPAAIEDADREEILLLSAKHLRDLLSRREVYGVTPETTAKYLEEPGAFQDDRLDQLDDEITKRIEGTTDLIAVTKALERADIEEGTADRLRLILKGMYDDEEVPSRDVIEKSLNFLAHPSIKLAREEEGQYRLETSTKSAKVLLRRFGNLIERIEDAKPED